MDKYPQDIHENLAWRAGLIEAANRDFNVKAEIKKLFHEDILFAFNAFFFTLDIRRRPEPHLPFITYPFQNEEILRIADALGGPNPHDYVIEKSRDMGASWMLVDVCVWHWLKLEEVWHFLWGSNTEKRVDNRGDMKTMFEKARYTLKYLPKWLKPEKFNKRIDDNYLKLTNPDTGSSITGESDNPSFSTAGRYNAVVFDEFSKWKDYDYLAWKAAGDASPCRIANSSASDHMGKMYDLCTDGKAKKTQLFWWLHPFKAKNLACVWPPPNEGDKEMLGEHWKPEIKFTSPWYEAECERREEEEIRQEIDMDWPQAGGAVFDGKAGASLKIYRKLEEVVECYGKIMLEEGEIEECPEPPKKDNYLIVYRKFQKNSFYTIGADVVEGVEGGDFAWITVFNRITKDVDAIWRSRWDEVILARVISIIADYYSPEPDSSKQPWIGIETTGPGLATFDMAFDMGIVNLFMATRYDIAKNSITYKKGWRTDTNSRNKLIAGIRKYLIDRAGKLNSQILVGEMLDFIRGSSGKAQARPGKHDDGVMSFGIALQLDEECPIEYETAKKAEIITMESLIEAAQKAEPRPIETVEEACVRTVLAKRAMNNIDLLEDELIYGGM